MKLAHIVNSTLIVIILICNTATYGQSLYPVYSAEKNSIFIELPNLDLTDNQYNYLQQGLPKVDGQDPIILSSDKASIVVDNLKLSTNDKYFYYNYSNNTLLQWNVTEVKVIATVDPYIDDFTYGLLIQDERLTSYGQDLSNGFVYIGKTSPFAQQKIEAITWKNIEKKTFPISLDFVKQLENSSTSEPWSNIDNVYKYSSANQDFYLAELSTTDYRYAQLFVIAKKNSNIINFYKLFLDSESLYLNRISSSDQYSKPLIGKLLKDQPLAFWGLATPSFGCPFIYFINYNELMIECVNNH